MEFNRPNLSNLDDDIRAYIESLEAEIARLKSHAKPEKIEEPPAPPLEPSEPPTTINLITITASGLAKRTPRHLYTRQRRGGMGIFDIDTSDDDPPTILALADENQSLLLITSQGRAFRTPVNVIPETEVRGRGASLVAKLNLNNGETLAAVVPVLAQGYLAIASRSGMVRTLRHHVFGEYMKPGAPLYDYKSFGPLAGACWTPGDGDLFIATRQGRAIRFSEKLVHPQGSLGIRLGENDFVVSIAPVYDDSGVFLLLEDGKGTIRQMIGFNANKAPGAGGKNALSGDRVIGAVNVDDAEDLFVISRLSKIIRFQVAEVPPKDGVVQGVNCMSFRADNAVALVASYPTSIL